MVRYTRRNGYGSVNTSDTYIEISSSVPYFRIFDMPVVSVV